MATTTRAESEYQKAYYRKNKENLLEYQKEYRERNPEYFKAYYQTHKEKYREYNRRRIAKLKAQGLCTQCRKTKEPDRVNVNWCNECKIKYSRMAVERRQAK